MPSRSGGDGSRRTEAQKEGEERGGSVQFLASSGAGLSGSPRSDLKDSKSSVIGSGSLASKDVPLEYTLTAGNPELHAKLAASGAAPSLPDAQMGLDNGVATIPEVEGEDQLPSPHEATGKDIDSVGIEIVNQEALRQENASEVIVLATSAGLGPMNRDMASLMTSNASEQNTGAAPTKREAALNIDENARSESVQPAAAEPAEVPPQDAEAAEPEQPSPLAPPEQTE